MDASGPRTIRPPPPPVEVEEKSHQPPPGTTNTFAPGDQNTLSKTQTLQASQDNQHQQLPQSQIKTESGPQEGLQHPVVPTFFGELVGTDGQGYRSLRKRVTDAYRWHTYQYWFVGFWSNALLFIQILVAASLTVLGSFKDNRARTASIFLGATNTVIAGLLTYFKSRNQPNRARQFRNDLAKVVDQLDDAEANFRDPRCREDPYVVMQRIRGAYEEARKDAEANYPDLWVKTRHFAGRKKEEESRGPQPQHEEASALTEPSAAGKPSHHLPPTMVHTPPGSPSTRHP